MTVINCSGAELSYDAWSSNVVSFIESLKNDALFQFRDNGYARFPGVLVTDGVSGSIRGIRSASGPIFREKSC